MPSKSSPICDDLSKISTKSSYQKNINLSENPKRCWNKKKFTPPNGLSLWMYENINVPPRCDHVFFIIWLFGPSVSEYIINGHFKSGKKWHMWCRFLRVHIISSKSPLHFSEVWITWSILFTISNFSVRFARFLGWTCIKQSIMCIAQRQNTEPQKRLEPETHLCWAEHYTTERLSFSKITSIVRTK